MCEWITSQAIACLKTVNIWRTEPVIERLNNTLSV